MEHFGIWNSETDTWLRFDNGAIFWTTSWSVARAQLEQIDPDDVRAELKIKAFTG